MDNGARLGWLINCQQQQVEIYPPNREVEILLSPQTLSAEDVLPGFVFIVGFDASTLPNSDRTNGKSLMP